MSGKKTEKFIHFTLSLPVFIGIIILLCAYFLPFQSGTDRFAAWGTVSDVNILALAVICFGLNVMNFISAVIEKLSPRAQTTIWLVSFIVSIFLALFFIVSDLKFGVSIGLLVFMPIASFSFIKFIFKKSRGRGKIVLKNHILVLIPFIVLFIAGSNSKIGFLLTVIAYALLFIVVRAYALIVRIFRNEQGGRCDDNEPPPSLTD